MLTILHVLIHFRRLFSLFFLHLQNSCINIWWGSLRKSCQNPCFEAPKAMILEFVVFFYCMTLKTTGSGVEPKNRCRVPDLTDHGQSDVDSRFSSWFFHPNVARAKMHLINFIVHQHFLFKNDFLNSYPTTSMYDLLKQLRPTLNHSEQKKTSLHLSPQKNWEAVRPVPSSFSQNHSTFIQEVISANQNTSPILQEKHKLKRKLHHYALKTTS